LAAGFTLSGLFGVYRCQPDKIFIPSSQGTIFLSFMSRWLAMNEEEVSGPKHMNQPELSKGILALALPADQSCLAMSLNFDF